MVKRMACAVLDRIRENGGMARAALVPEEELFSGGSCRVWIQFRGTAPQTGCWVLTVHRSGSPVLLVLCDICCGLAHRERYSRTWRCWTEHPGRRQAEGTPWEPEQNG